jgi:hypothetical protein
MHYLLTAINMSYGIMWFSPYPVVSADELSIYEEESPSLLSVDMVI